MSPLQQTSSSLLIVLCRVHKPQTLPPRILNNRCSRIWLNKPQPWSQPLKPLIEKVREPLQPRIEGSSQQSERATTARNKEVKNKIKNDCRLRTKINKKSFWHIKTKSRNPSCPEQKMKENFFAADLCFGFGVGDNYLEYHSWSLPSPFPFVWHRIVVIKLCSFHDSRLSFGPLAH